MNHPPGHPASPAITEPTQAGHLHARGLPHEFVRDRRRQRTVLLLVLTASLLLAANLGAGVLLRRFSPNRGYRLIERKWAMLEAANSPLLPVDTLILGDSSGNQGIDPRAVAAHFGGRAVNLCTVGDLLLLNDAWMLERYLQKYPPPKRLILAHVYDVWQRRPRARNFTRVPVVPAVGEMAATPPLTMTPGERATLLMDRLLPLYSENESVSLLLRRPLYCWSSGITEAPPSFAGFEPRPAGAPGAIERNARQHLHGLKRTRGGLSEANRAALARIDELAAAHGFEVYISVGPVYEAFANDPVYQRFWGESEAAIRSAVAAMPYVHLAVPRPTAAPLGDLESVDHVSEIGAAIYTSNLLRSITGPRMTK